MPLRTADGARADARRNRVRLVEAARMAFAEAETDESRVTLEQVARTAGVGIGTLYRHFPTREDLVEAVYRAELAVLCASASELLAVGTPLEALRGWMDRFAVYVRTKRDMAETLRAVFASGAVTRSDVREQLAAAVREILVAGVANGSFRPQVRAEDVVVSVVGTFVAAGDSAQVTRMLDLIVAGVARRP